MYLLVNQTYNKLFLIYLKLNLRPKDYMFRRYESYNDFKILVINIHNK